MPDLTLAGLGETVRRATAELAMVARLTRDLPDFLRDTIPLAEARARIVDDLAMRERRFLDLVQRSVYAFPGSPNARLLRHAGCEPGDLRALVASAGLEGALETLLERGVYVTYDEMKGRRAVERGSTRFEPADSDFDNPLLRPHFAMYSGGTRGRPTRVNRTLDLVAELACEYAVVLDALGVHRPHHVLWKAGAVNRLFVFAKLAQPVSGWFLPTTPVPFGVTLGARYLRALVRPGGRRIPLPRLLELERPERMVAWLAPRLRAGEQIVLNATASSAARVAIAARDAGLSLRGLTLHAASEPVTAARRQHMEEAGAQIMVTYGSTEIQGIAFSCAAPRRADDLHLFENRVAVVQRRRTIGEGGPGIDALAFTALSPHSSKIMINAEPGDYAEIERRDCDCALGRLGLRTHLSSIRSFEKLSSEGTTFARSKLLTILETSLPARFGGTGLDYQVVEEERPHGVNVLILRVSPDLGAVDERALREAFLTELGRGGIVDQHHARLLERAGSIVVSRARPLVTAAGKMLPFHLARLG